MSNQPARQLDPPFEAVQLLTAELERQLRVKHPRLAGYLDMTIQARRLWGGGYEVLDEIYPTPEAAAEAVKAAIVHKLIAAERCGHSD
jgi:hypothetical protein